MTDLFDNTILCSKCNLRMKPLEIERNGFILRAVQCEKCGEKIIHPKDESEFQEFQHLKNKEFRVKMRIVGNSYAVSIPKEIVSFMMEQENRMNDMVKLCFEDLGRVSLSFNQHEMGDGKSRIVKAREYRVVKNNKPILHLKQFADSANPKNNRTVIRRGE